MPDIIKDKTIAIRISQFMVQSVEKIRYTVNNTFTKLNSKLNISSDNFDSYMLSAISENTMLNILFGLNEHISNSFFQVVLSNNDNSTAIRSNLTFLIYLSNNVDFKPQIQFYF